MIEGEEKRSIRVVARPIDGEQAAEDLASKVVIRVGVHACLLVSG
jgi:hypothetical protein